MPDPALMGEQPQRAPAAAARGRAQGERLSLAISGLALGWAMLSWGWCWWRVSSILDLYGRTFTEVYLLHEPGFAQGFRNGLPTTLGELFRNGDYGSWWVVAAGVVVLVCWWLPASQIRNGRLAPSHLLVTVAPFLVGIAYFPWGVIELTAALAKAGLNSPAPMGSVFSTAASPAIFGFLESGVLLAGLIVWGFALDRKAERGIRPRPPAPP